MKKALRKSSLREIKGTFGRFFAILAIIALGVGFFTGVRITTPAMVSMMDDFVSRNQLYDLRLVSTLGWEEEDVEAFREKEGVRAAEGSNSLDVLFIGEKNEEMVMKTHTIPQQINGFELIEGRLPQSPDECIADSKNSKMTIGKVIRVSDENEEKTSEQMTESEFTVVGIAQSSYYIQFERGSTSIGNGSVDGFLYIMPEALDTDVYTEVFVKLDSDYEMYSDEYDDMIKDITPKWERFSEAQADLRYERVKASADEDISDGRQELEKSREDGQKELDDAKAELDKALQELIDAGAGFRTASDDIAEGKKALDEAKKQLDESKKQLDDSEKKLKDGEAQLNDGQASLDSAKEQLRQGEEELSAKETELQANEAAFQAQYGEALAMLDSLPEDQRAAITAAQSQLNSARQQLDSAKSELEKNRAELETQQAALDQSRAELTAGRTEFEEGKKKYEDGLNEYEKSAADYEKGKKDYDDGIKEYEDGWKKYQDGLYEYQDGLEEFDEKIADAESELADAAREVRELSDPDVFVLDRNTNIGYACFENDSEIVEQVARVFPIFFILVAALVCITTMSRMVEEQRTQIGTLKALGYSNGSIAGKFIFYSGSAALLGCIIGYSTGTFLFPRIIWMTYKLMYIPLDIPYLFDWKLAVLSAAASLLCSVGTTFIACRAELTENAAGLMRPKAPKAGKRVFLEYVPFIWNRLKFLHKVSIRNILRYKGRFFMMIFGIGGCTALLLTGFGLKDSIAGFADVQYGEVMTADASLAFKPDNGGLPEKVKEVLDEKAENYAVYHSSAWDLVYSGNKVKSITLMAPENFEMISDFIDFRTMEGDPVAYPGYGEAIVSHSVAERYGAKVGSEITLRSEDMEELHLTVTGIFENHVYNYVFTGYDTVSSQLRTQPELNGAYLDYPDGSDPDKTGADISRLSDATNLTQFNVLRTRMGNMMSSLNYIVLLVIICAAGLAFIVIYNLTNINITERIREIATIKVLGFFRRETSAYVLRENLVLTLIGALAGLGLGILLHRSVMLHKEVSLNQDK